MLRNTTRLVIVAAACAALGGCAAGGGRAEPARATEAERGLTVYTYIASEQDQAAMARWLSPYLGGAPDGELAANGLRVVKAPASRLGPLLRELNIRGSQRQLVGMLHRFGPISRSAPWGGVGRLTMSDGELVLGPGRLRLLARCWAAPDVPGSPAGGPVGVVLVVELLPQHEAAERAVRPLGGATPTARMDERDAGLCFDRLSVTIPLRRDEVAIIAPVSPDDDWAELIARETGPRPETSEPVAAGPTPARPPTLGEAMLTDYGLEGRARSRALLVLVPDLPPEFRLLP